MIREYLCHNRVKFVWTRKKGNSFGQVHLRKVVQQPVTGKQPRRLKQISRCRGTSEAPQNRGKRNQSEGNRQRKTKMTKLMQWLLGGFIFACVWGFLLSSPMSQTCELTRHVVVFLPFYALLVFGVCSSRTNSCHCHREANDLVPEHIVKPHPRCGDGIQQLLKFVVGNNILVTYLYLRQISVALKKST